MCLLTEDFFKQRLVVGFQFQLQNSWQWLVFWVLTYLLFFSVEKRSQSRIGRDPKCFLYLFFGNVHG